MRNIKSDDKEFKELSKKLQNKLELINRSILIKDIKDTIECLKIFKSLMEQDVAGIIKSIQLLTDEQIQTFESFSKKFGSIIELENKNEEDPFKEVYDIIQDGSLLFNLDNEDFGYNKDRKFKKIESIEELVKFKNKINIQPQRKIKENDYKNNETNKKNEEVEILEKDIFQIKCDKLLFFKDIIFNLEIIYDKINILREKGFNMLIVTKCLYKIS